MAKDDDFTEEELDEELDDDLDDDLGDLELDDDAADGDEDLDADDDVADEDEEEDEALEEEDDEELEEESLDVLLARDQGLDENELVREDQRDGLGLTTAPGAGEFTCRSCFLVKRRAQLADEKRMICFDCA